MSPIAALLGSDLMNKDGPVKITDALEGKTHVMLYFSAHWCPPCRGFTPCLAKAYKERQTNVEVVFISSDRDEAAFEEYFADMPWLALPYVAREKKDELSKTFEVRGIPTLIILDAEGNLVTRNGRAEYEAYFGIKKELPVPASWTDLLGPELRGKEGVVKTEDALLAKKHVMLYFSAHWCPPCRGFTPELAKAYEAKTENTEIVFISADQDDDQFQEYYKEMPWLALPYDRQKTGDLAEAYEVCGIPTLVVLDSERKFVGSGRNHEKYLQG